VVDNRRARHDYELSEFTVCGIVLFGSEARSIRDGNVSIAEAYCLVSRGEMFVRGMRVEPLKHAAMGQEHNPDRDKKLLLNRREIDRLEAKTHGTGLTIVPVELVLVGRNFKLKVALGRGKKKWDKRQSEKEKSARREMRGE
jgi:SsrA-binding protein